MVFDANQLMDSIEDVFAEENCDDILKECLAAYDGVCGLRVYSVTSGGEVIGATAGRPDYCATIQETEIGRQACEEHFVGIGRRASDPDEPPEVRTCHAGLACWGLRLGGHGVIGACGGRIKGVSSLGDAIQTADMAGADSNELKAAFKELPEHTPETFKHIIAAVGTGLQQLCTVREQLAQYAADSETDRTRLRQARRELAAVKAEYESICRETYEKNEEQIKANEGLREQVAENEEMFMAFVRALATTVDAKDAYTHDHSRRVTQIALLTAKEMDVTEEQLRTLEIAGYLHDIGKIGMPDRILNKPGRLDDDEFLIVKRHPVVGSRILSGVRHLQQVATAVRHHHERFDGTGYPDGLEGEEIPRTSRILAVADTFDAITSDRPYRKGASVDVAVEELHRWSGVQFDPDILAAFCRAQEDRADIEAIIYGAETPECVAATKG